MTVAKSLVESTWAVIVSRAFSIAGPLMIALLAWLAPQYLDGRFAEVKSQAAAAAVTAANATVMATSASDTARDVKGALATVQAIQADNTEANRSFQDHMTQQVDKLTTIVSQDSVTLAGVAATVNIIKDRPSSVASSDWVHR